MNPRRPNQQAQGAQGQLGLGLDLPTISVAPTPKPKRAPKTEFEKAMAEVFLDRDVMRVWGAFAVWRDEFVKRFSWGALGGATVRALLPHGPFLEVGAGSGYWAHELAKAGADVVATNLIDPNEPRYFERQWHPVEEVGAVEAVRRYPGRTLLSVWPEDDAWPGAALAEHRRQGGERFVYLGLGRGGCTGGDALFDELTAHWVEVETIPCLTWHTIGDRLVVYRRKMP
jgi:hypothetical protein